MSEFALSVLHLRTQLGVSQVRQGACITETGAIGGRFLGMTTQSGQLLTAEGVDKLSEPVQG